MKKLLIVGIILLVGFGAYKLIDIHKTKNFSATKGNKSIVREIHHDNYKNNSDWHYTSNYGKYSEVDGKPFNKGYNGDYDKAAVEQATKEHSKVTLNNEFKVIGVKKVNGLDAIYKYDLDGDTIVVAFNNNKNDLVTIRFASMDTAEDINPRIKVIEPFSVQGGDFVKSKLKEGEQIKIVTNGNKGRYGRTVGYIYYKENGEWYNLNEELVSNGLARIAYVPYSERHSKLIDEFYKAEDSAKEQNLNIWSIKGYATKLGYNLAIFK